MAYLSFKKGKKGRFGTQFQHTMTNKKARRRRAFCVHYQLGLSAPNPDTRNFSRKVSWNFKSFRQNEVIFLREILRHTFLRKKGVSVFFYVVFKLFAVFLNLFFYVFCGDTCKRVLFYRLFEFFVAYVSIYLCCVKFRVTEDLFKG